MNFAAENGIPTELAAATHADAAQLTLDARGLIHYCNEVTESLFKYQRSELVSLHVSTLLPEFADLDLLQDGEIGSRLRFLMHTGKHFQAVTKDDVCFRGDIFLNNLDSAGEGCLSLLVRPVEAVADPI